MRADRSGRIALLALHFDRLEKSAHALGHVYPGRTATQAALSEKLTPQPIELPTELPTEVRVRLLLAPTGELTVTTAPLPGLLEPQRVALSTTTLPSGSVWLQHKTTHRPWYQAAMGWIDEHPGFFDLIYLNERGEVCEGSRSSIYAKINGHWITPPTSCGLLGGVQRRALLESEAIKEAVLYPDDLLRAQGLRLSNALRGWFDVSLDTSVKD